jgi:glycosyltransferase involved in cell wall biosynthesis
MANAPKAPTSRGSAIPGPSLYWFSQTIGPGRGLETALEAIAIAQTHPHFYLRGTPAVGYREHLMARANALGVCDRLHFLEPGAPDDMERLGSIYDLGYAGEDGATRNHQIALANKIFSYVISGIPIVATDVQSHRDISEQIKIGMTLFEVGNSTMLASIIDRIILDKIKFSEMRAEFWTLGQTNLNWDTVKVEFLDKVRETFSQ